MGYDPYGTLDWGTFISGVSQLITGVGAIAAGAAILACASAPPLMVAVAVVTVAAGVLTTVNGTAEMIEAETGNNFVRDNIMEGDEQTYEVYKTVTQTVASAGTLICGASYAYNGGNICFVAGTLVATAIGNVDIETVEIGDYVWAQDTETGEKGLKPVVNVFVNETNELIHIFTENEEIVCTNEHPFYSPVRGWIEACQLRAGDILLRLNGEYIIVEQVQHEILESPIKVYNFEVADFHTYFVGDDEVLVHNSCQKHHIMTNKNKMYTPEFQRIADKYNLSLNGPENIRLTQNHLGRHANSYHSFIKQKVTSFDIVAAGDRGKFMKYFDFLADYVVKNPHILY